MKKISDFILDNLVIILGIIGLIVYLGSIGETFGIIIIATPAIFLMKNLADIIYLTWKSIETKNNLFTVKKTFFIVISTVSIILFFWLIGLNSLSVN